EKVELPDQIPHIMQARIHLLPTKWVMNVSRVASDEDTSAAQPRYLPVMDAKIAAPVQDARLEPTWCALTEYLLHEVQRRRVAFRVLDGRHDAAAGGTHRKNGERSEFAWAQLQLVCGKNFIRLDVSQHERGLIFCSLKR